MRFFQKTSVKIFLIFVFLILILFAITTYFVNRFTYSSMVEQVRINDLNMISIISNAIESEQEKVRLSGLTLQHSEKLIQYMEDITERAKQDKSIYLQEDSRTWFELFQGLYSPALTLLDAEGYLIGETFYERQSVYNFLGRTAVSRFSQEKVTLCSMYHVQRTDNGERNSVIPFVFPIKSEEGTLLGFAVLYLPEENLHACFLAYGSSVAILNPDNVILSCADERILYKNYFNYYRINYSFLLKDTTAVTEINGEEYIFTARTVNEQGWQIVIAKNAAESLSEANYNGKYYLFVFLAAFAMAVVVIFLIAFFIGRPISKLNESVEKVKLGDLSERSHIKSKDEIGQLSTSFNEMLDTINVLLRETEENGRARRKAQMQLIQAQMKPHFLYNVLGLISGCLNEGNTQQGNLAIDSLASFYRISLSNGNDVIPLKKEIELVEKYLTLQQMRYVGMIDYEIDIDEELEMIRIPKLTLQPLVENAIDHGIRNKDGGGFISIKGRADGDYAVIRVRDNGLGITPEKLEEVDKVLHSHTVYAHFGLSSIARRLELCYAQQTSIQIESVPGEYTQVTLRIPCAQDGGE